MTNAYVKLKQILPPAPVLVGLVTAHHEDDTSTVVLPTQEGRIEYAAGVAAGSTIRARGTTVPVGDKAFVRNGVIETRAPDGDAVEIVVGVVLAPSAPLTFNGPIADQEGTQGAAFSLDVSGYWTGGEGSPVFGVASGTLPAGLTLSGAGVISGTPTTVAVTLDVILRATDAAGSRADSNAIDFNVAAPLAARWLAQDAGTRVVWYSDDWGATWTSTGYAFPAVIHACCWGNGLFVAGAYANATNNIYTSPDGITWTQRTVASSGARTSAAWNGSIFVVGSSNLTSRIETSPDGITWTTRTVPLTTGGFVVTGVMWVHDMFVVSALAATSQFLATSPDGITWTAQSPPQLYGGSGFTKSAIKVGSTYTLLPEDSTSRFLTTSAFSSYTQGSYGSTPFPVLGRNPQRIASNGSVWVFASSNGLFSTTDGVTFTRQIAGSFGNVHWDGLKFVVLHSSGTVYTSTDGVTWASSSMSAFANCVGLAVAHAQLY